jgi:hypothetical protein
LSSETLWLGVMGSPSVATQLKDCIFLFAFPPRTTEIIESAS